MSKKSFYRIYINKYIGSKIYLNLFSNRKTKTCHLIEIFMRQAERNDQRMSWNERRRKKLLYWKENHAAYVQRKINNDGKKKKRR